jgi:hypothetical protein
VPLEQGHLLQDRAIITVISVADCTVYAQVQVYFQTTPAKVFNLRPDTLAVMINQAGVGPHSRVLCIDACFGLVATACAERMAGCGTLCCAHMETQRYRLETPRLLNVPTWLAVSARQTSLSELLTASQPESAPAATECPVASPGEAAVNKREESVGRSMDRQCGGTAAGANKPEDAAVVHMDAQCENGDSGEIVDEAAERTAPEGSQAAGLRIKLHEPIPKGVKVPESIMPATDSERADMVKVGFTSLLLAAPRFDYSKVMQMVLPLLCPSASFALFSPSLQPLTECFQALQLCKQCIALQVCPRSSHKLSRCPLPITNPTRRC